MANLDLFRSRDTNDTPPVTPGQRASKRARYNLAAPSEAVPAGASASSSLSIAKELADAKRMVQAFDAIDSSVTEAREKLKIFYKTADETNTLLDMWIRLLSQTEHTLNLLQDPDWEGRTKEEIQAKETMEKRSALEEAIRRETMSSRALLRTNQSANFAGAGVAGGAAAGLGAGSSSSSSSASATIPASRQGNLASSSSSATAMTNTAGSLRRSQLAHSLSKRPTSSSSTSTALAAAHAHASAVAANRRRPEAGGSTGGLPTRSGANGTTSISAAGGRITYP